MGSKGREVDSATVLQAHRQQATTGQTLPLGKKQPPIWPPQIPGLAYLPVGRQAAWGRAFVSMGLKMEAPFYASLILAISLPVANSEVKPTKVNGLANLASPPITTARPSPFCLVVSFNFNIKNIARLLELGDSAERPYSCQQTDKNVQMTPLGLFREKSQSSP